MNATRKILVSILGCLLALGCVLIILTYKYGNLNEVVLYNALQNQNVSTLSTDQKVFLFRENVERKNIQKALLVGAEFHNEIKNIDKADRVYIAGHLGLIFRENGGHDQELQLYEDFFMNEYPALFHAFRASAFKAVNNLEMYNTELKLAKEMAKETQDALTGELLAKYR